MAENNDKQGPRFVVLLPGDDDYPDDLKGGNEARLYNDGSIRNDLGYMLVPLPGKHTITRQDAASLARRKHEIYKESFAAGVVSGAISRGFDVTTDAEAWQAVGQHAAKTYFQTDNARSLAALGDFIAKKGGFVRVAEDRDAETGEGIARGVAAGAVSALLRALRGADNG